MMITNGHSAGVARFKRDGIYGVLVDDTSRSIYLEWRSMGAMLSESTLTQDQIRQIFAAISDGAKAGLNVGDGSTDGPAPKSGILGSISQSWSNFKDKISQSRPVSGFDVAFDKLQDKILNASGGSSGKVGKMLQVYKDFGNKYPKLQSAIYYGITIAAGLSGWGLGGVAILAALKTLNRLLQGDRLSSALWKGFKTLAVGAAAGSLFGGDAGDGGDTQGTGDGSSAPTGAEGIAVPVPDMSDYVVKYGDTLSEIAQANRVSVEELMKVNPEITNPDVLKVGQILNIPSPTDTAVYDKGVGTAADTFAKIKSGSYTDSPISQAGAAKWGLKENIDRRKMQTIWENQAYFKLPQVSAVYLTPVGVQNIIDAHCGAFISEGIFDTFKDKITKDKLDLFWRKNYGEYQQDDGVEVDVVIDFLRRMGVKDELTKKVFADLNIPMGKLTPADLPPGGSGTAPNAGASKQAAATAPAVSATGPTVGQEFEFPGTNTKFKYTASWVTPDGKVASDAAATVLNKLAAGVDKADLPQREIIAARRFLYPGAMGMTENKKIKKGGR